MQIPSGRIEKCVSDETVRYALKNVMFEKDAADAETGRLVASDGKLLVCLNVECLKEDVAGFISPDVLKAGRKAHKAISHPVTLNGKAVVATKDGKGTVEMPRMDIPEDSHFPDWKACIPAKSKGDTFIYLDAEKLLRLADALSGGNRDESCIVEIRIPEETGKAMTVRAYGDVVKESDASFGLLMPVAGPTKH